MSLSNKELAIPLGSTVLITGITGLIGSHVANQLLLAGFKVRGTTRSASKGQWLSDMFEKQYGAGKFELVEVSEMNKADSYDQAMQALFYRPLRIYLLQHRYHPPKPDKKSSIDTFMWNEADIEAAWKPPPYDDEDRPWAVYGASKTQTEQAAWKFMSEKTPSFILNTVLPNANFGKILSPENQTGSTAGWIKSIYQSGKVDGVLLNFPPQWFIDVEDTARLHVAGLIDPEVTGDRILGFAEPFNLTDVLGVLRELYPEKTFQFEKEGGEGHDLMELDDEPGVALLRKWFGRAGWTPLKESVKNNTEGL